MRKSKNNRCKAGTLLLSILLSIMLLPVGSFALDAPEAVAPGYDQQPVAEDVAGGGELPDAEVDQAVDTPEVTEAEEPVVEAAEGGVEEPPAEEPPSEFIDDTDPPGTIGTNFTLNGRKVQFKSAVVEEVQDFMKPATIHHIWIKAAKTLIKVNWDLPTNKSSIEFADGVVVLRKAGKETVYKEIARIPFKTNKNGELFWDPVTSYADRTAKTANKTYSYIIVSYYDEGPYTYISNSSEWATGRTTKSKLKNGYTATINKKSASLQYKGTVKLSMKFAKPKTIFMSNSKNFRWYSDNTAVAKVSSNGKVTATGVGTTTIRGRLPSGADMTCKVSVVGAFKPSAPTIKVDIATESSISLIWTKAKNATSYDLYQSNDGLHWKAPVRVKGTSKKVTGLTKNHRYTFYVVARNDNNGYTALSGNSNVVNQKAVIKRRPTGVSGFPKSKTLTAGTTYTVSIKVKNPESRKASLQIKNGSKWTTKKTIALPKGDGTFSKKITFPKDWWGKTTSWRLVLPKTNTVEGYTTATLTIKSARRYQNPKAYVQISDTISKHGYSYYTSPVRVSCTSTKADHVNALINTAGKYVGSPYREGRSGSPSAGVDASGLIIQSCYGAGVDLWPISPSTRPSNCVPKIMNSKLKKISYKEPAEGSTDYPTLLRGDLIFFYLAQGTSSSNVIGHVAIYTGYGNIIHASRQKGKVERSTIKELTDKDGIYKYKVAGVRRIFN